MSVDIQSFEKVTMAHADWIIDLAEEVYDQKLDRESVKAWMADATTYSDVFFYRGKNSVGLASAITPFYGNAPKVVHMVYLFARRNRTLEGYKMLLTMVLWAKSIGASAFHFGSAASGVDLEPFARRLTRYGARQERPTWTVDL